MNGSQFGEAIRHGGADSGLGEARDHRSEVVSPVEAVFELGQAAWLLTTDGAVDPTIVDLMLPGVVLAHLQ
jgi:hypothetical protein